MARRSLIVDPSPCAMCTAYTILSVTVFHSVRHILQITSLRGIDARTNSLTRKSEGWKDSESRIHRIRIDSAFSSYVYRFLNIFSTCHLQVLYMARVRCTKQQPNIGLQPHRLSFYPNAPCMPGSPPQISKTPFQEYKANSQNAGYPFWLGYDHGT